MVFTLLFLKALETGNLEDHGGWVNVFPKFSWSEALSWRESQSNCETKMPQQGPRCQSAPQMIKTETPKGPGLSVLCDDEEYFLAFGPHLEIIVPLLCVGYIKLSRMGSQLKRWWLLRRGLVTGIPGIRPCRGKGSSEKGTGGGRKKS